MVKNIVVILAYICVILSHVLAAPVDVSQPKSGNVKTTHITKGDILLLKEKLAALEADIDLLEPEVPEEEIPAEDQNAPTTVEPVEPVEPEPVEPVNPIEPIEPVEPVVPVEPVEPTEPEPVQPEQTQAEEDEYLRKLVIQALTAIYKEDADRIGQMLDDYYSKLMSNEYYAQHVQEDLDETVAHVPQTESGSFLDKPFSDAELDDQEAVSGRKQLIADAEEKLLTDIETFQDQGLTIDELLADLDEQEQDAERLEEGTALEESDEETEVDTLLFGDIVVENEDGDETDVDNDETIADELLNDLLANLESRNTHHGSQIPRDERMM